ncbi:MAG: DNA polymerase III subunit delta [Fidelibacterota bacterium]
MKFGYREMIKEIQSGDVKPVYFLNGSDFYMQNYFVQEVEKSLESRFGSLSKVSLIPSVRDVADILQDLQSIPLFPEPKLYIIRNPSVFRDSSRRELLAYCRSPKSDNFLILIIDEVDRRKKLNVQLEKIVGKIFTSSPPDYKMSKWINFLFKQKGLRATESAIESLQELAGDTVYHAANEIEKISLGVNKGFTISEKEVYQYAGWNRNYIPGDFQDAVGSRNLLLSYQIGINLLESGTKLTALISYLTNLFLEMNYRNLSKNSEKYYHKREPWLSNSVRNKMPQYQALYHQKEIRAIFNLLLKADKDIKNSVAEDDRILISLLYRIIQGNEG